MTSIGTLTPPEEEIATTDMQVFFLKIAPLRGRYWARILRQELQPPRGDDTRRDLALMAGKVSTNPFGRVWPRARRLRAVV